MGFATLVYNATAAAAGATNTDLVAATDPDFSTRNSHYVFTNDLRLYESMAVGVSVTRGRFQCPTWNAIGELQIFNANRALQPPSNPQWDVYDTGPLRLPKNEEFQVQLSNNLGAATEQESVILNLITDDWNANFPPGSSSWIFGSAPFITRASFTVTPTANAWSGGQNLTLSQNLRGGTYAVVGATVQGTNSVAFRIIFPRYRLYQGRKLRPGGPTQTAVGDVICNQHRVWMMRFGEWGRFHTFELPQVEVFGTTASSTTYQVFLWMIFLGESEALLNAGLGGGY